MIKSLPVNKTLLSALLFAMLLALNPTAIAGDNVSKITRSLAIKECQKGILRDAHDPGSVKFTNTVPMLIRSVNESGLFTIELTIEIRAKNGYNALRKGAVTCNFFEFGESDLMLYQIVQSE